MLHTINSEAELKDNKLKGFNRKVADNECNYLKTINKHITVLPKRFMGERIQGILKVLQRSI